MARTGPITRDSSSVALGLAQIRVGKSAPSIATATPVLTSADSMGAMAKTAFTGDVKYWKMESGFPAMEDITLPLSEAAKLECEFRELSSKNLALARGIDVFADVSAKLVGTPIKDSVAGTTTGVITVTDAGGVVADTWTVVFATATTGTIYGKNTGNIHDFANLSAIMAPVNGANPYFSIPANFFSGTWAAKESYVFETSPYVSGTSAYADSHSGDILLGTMVAPAFIRMEAVYTYPNGVNTMTIIFPRANVTSSLDVKLAAEDSSNVPVTFEAKQSNSDTAGGHAVWNTCPLGKIIFA